MSKFRKNLHKLRKILVKEMMDGCNTCREEGGLCNEHWKEAAQMVLKPKETKLREEMKHLRK